MVRLRVRNVVSTVATFGTAGIVIVINFIIIIYVTTVEEHGTVLR